MLGASSEPGSKVRWITWSLSFGFGLSGFGWLGLLVSGAEGADFGLAAGEAANPL